MKTRLQKHCYVIVLFKVEDSLTNCSGVKNDYLEEDPKKLWDEVNNLLPCKPRQIPLKVQRGNDYITDVNDVLHAWSSDFSRLYNRAPRDAPSDNSDDFYDNCMSHRNIIEN